MAIPNIVEADVFESHALHVIGPVAFTFTHTGCPAKTLTPDTVYVFIEPIESDIPLAIFCVLGHGVPAFIESRLLKSVLSPLGPFEPGGPGGPGMIESAPVVPLGPDGPVRPLGPEGPPEPVGPLLPFPRAPLGLYKRYQKHKSLSLLKLL